MSFILSDNAIFELKKYDLFKNYIKPLTDNTLIEYDFNFNHLLENNKIKGFLKDVVRKNDILLTPHVIDNNISSCLITIGHNNLRDLNLIYKICDKINELFNISNIEFSDFYDQNISSDSILIQAVFI